MVIYLKFSLLHSETVNFSYSEKKKEILGKKIERVNYKEMHTNEKVLRCKEHMQKQ